jgi:hypothetical protein
MIFEFQNFLKLKQQLVFKDFSIYLQKENNSYLQFECSILPGNKISNNIERNNIFSNSIGCGLSINPAKAFKIAFYEAVERFAHSQLIVLNHLGKDVGFHINSTTTGFAAHRRGKEGLHYSSRNSLLEATERIILKLWWEESVFLKDYSQHNFLFCEIKEIKAFFTITWESFLIENEERFSYGFSCKNSLQESLFSSSVEMSRNKRTVINHAKIFNGKTKLNTAEENLLYFSRATGFNEFTKKISLARKTDRIKLPALLLSKEVKGEWSQYASVWRTLYVGQTSMYNGFEKYFMF